MIWDILYFKWGKKHIQTEQHHDGNFILIIFSDTLIACGRAHAQWICQMIAIINISWRQQQHEKKRNQLYAHSLRVSLKKSVGKLTSGAWYKNIHELDHKANVAQITLDWCDTDWFISHFIRIIYIYMPWTFRWATLHFH